jgi:hypothetical protein
LAASVLFFRSIVHAQDSNDLRFRFLGPLVGNRIASVAGVPGDPNTYYDDKYYVEPYRIYLNLIWLNGEVGQALEMWRAVRITA